MPIPTSQVQPNAEGKLPCPECGKPYNDKPHLGIHRLSAHKVAGTSTNALSRKKLKTATKKSAKPVATAKLVAKPLSKFTKQDKLTDAEIKKMQAMRKSGATRVAIARESGRSLASVDRAIRFNVPRSNNGSSNGSPYAAKILKMHDRGMRPKQIAVALGIDVSSVYYHVHKQLRTNPAPPKSTQTPTQETSQHGNSNGTETAAEQDYQQSLIYCYARLEKEAQIFAEGRGLSWPLLASGLADLFKLQTRGKVMGMPYRMSALPGQTS